VLETVEDIRDGCSSSSSSNSCSSSIRTMGESEELRMENGKLKMGVQRAEFDAGQLGVGGAVESRTRSRRTRILLPLNARGRLGADVVEHAVHAFDAVEDLVGGVAEDAVGQLDPVGGHGVFADDGAEARWPARSCVRRL
jgi:hypothetical protein